MTNAIPLVTPDLPGRPTGRRMLILLATLFALPFVAGTVLFLSGWRPSGVSHHGELVQPPRPLPESGLADVVGQPLPTVQLSDGKWLLLMPVATACVEDCQQRLQQIQQVHVALGKEQTRVRRVFLGTGMDNSIPADLQRNFPELVVAKIVHRGPKAGWDDALAGFDNDILIVDPFGNVMMRYDGTANMRGVLKDLERLLKYSWIR